jgi:pSer/pThr/pTyr-binding forkhead associated (FHA) protein
MSRPAPFLLYRDDAGRRLMWELDAAREQLTIGRRPSCDLALPWDDSVSRLHAELVRMGTDWVLCDDGLSHNGTFVNGERVRGRRRLRDGDMVTAGATQIMFSAPQNASTTMSPTQVARERTDIALTPAQRRLLTALCRPLTESAYAPPASNRQIAEELVLSVETVKGTLSALFERFGVAHLPQNQKRAALAARALGLLQR